MSNELSTTISRDANATFELVKQEDGANVLKFGSHQIVFPRARYARDKATLQAKPNGGWAKYKNAAIKAGDIAKDADKKEFKELQEQYKSEKKGNEHALALYGTILKESGMQTNAVMRIWTSADGTAKVSVQYDNKEEKLPDYDKATKPKRENNEAKFKRMAEKFGCTVEDVKKMWNK
tara:strand:+ start:1048 stop:1581 length:534 start_codon:yes stop_codon:yes gene_type:complete